MGPSADGTRLSNRPREVAGSRISCRPAGGIGAKGELGGSLSGADGLGKPCAPATYGRRTSPVGPGAASRPPGSSRVRAQLLCSRMLYDPRTIAFVTEAYFPPMQQDGLRVQQVHHELFGSARAGYRNFNLVAGGAMLSNPHINGSANSSVTVLQDRVRIAEELTDTSLDDFLARQEIVLRLLAQKLEIPVFVACQVAIRSLVSSRQYRDARDFLARGVLRFNDDGLAPFGRAPHTLGLRFVFPQSADERNVYQVRIESYTGDVRSVFLENVGMFPGVVLAGDVEKLGEPVRQTYNFLTERVLEFLARFDQRTSIDGLER